MTDYYVDPLNGSNSNDGLSSGTAFGSYAWCMTGTVSGVTNPGNVIYLMASTGDTLGSAVVGDSGAQLGILAPNGVTKGTTAGNLQIRAINPTTLKEDGTKYVIFARDNQYAFMHGKVQDTVWYNIKFVGSVSSYSSGASTYGFINCEFADKHGGTEYTGMTNWHGLDNQSGMHINCKFISSTGAADYVCYRGGGVYGQSWVFDSCEFVNLSGAVLGGVGVGTKGGVSSINGRWKNVGSCVFFTSSGDRPGAGGQFVNNIVDGTDNSAMLIDSVDDDSIPGLDESKLSTTWNNVFNNIGGYVFEYTRAGAVEVATYADDRNSYSTGINLNANVVQGAVSGIHSLPINEFLLSARFAFDEYGGTTYGSFGLTHDTVGTQLMVATGDNYLFQLGKNPTGMGQFLHSFTEQVGKPEFGDVF